MRKNKVLGLIATVAIFSMLSGCKIEIAVPEGGKVITESGNYTCLSGTVCTLRVYDTVFDEKFIASPNTGFIFSEWKKKPKSFCGGSSAPCALSTTAFSDFDVLMSILASDELFYLEPIFANTWAQLGANIPGETSRDRSGTAVSISSDGKRLAVGAPGNTADLDGVYDVGQVRVYESLNNRWQQFGSDINGRAAGDHLGSSVSLSGNGSRLAVGAIRADANGTESGQVQVLGWWDGAWRQLGGDINGEVAYDDSGTSVSLSADGKRVAIGAPGNGGNGYRSGHVRVYQWIDRTWQQLGSDIDGKSAGESSGYSVSLSRTGDFLAVGAIDNDDNGDNSGAARVYAWSGTRWSQLGNDVNGQNLYDWFGRSVSLSADGSRLAVGTGQADYVRVYDWSGTKWTQLGDDINGPASGERFGYSLALSADGGRLAIGNHWNKDNGYNAGQVRLYAWSGTDWRQLLGEFNGSAGMDNFGFSVALSGSGSQVAAGAPGANRGGYAAVHEMAYAENPPPPVDPMKVYLLNPEHTEQIPQNNPSTNCPYDPLAGYGLRVDFDWSDAQSTAGIAGYHLRVKARYAQIPDINVFVTESEYSWVSCGSYLNNLAASSGVGWSVQAEDNNGNPGPLNDEGFFVFELCRLDNGDACGGN